MDESNDRKAMIVRVRNASLALQEAALAAENGTLDECGEHLGDVMLILMTGKTKAQHDASGTQPPDLEFRVRPKEPTLIVPKWRN